MMSESNTGANAQWEDDLEADQLERLAAREGREDQVFDMQVPADAQPEPGKRAQDQHRMGKASSQPSNDEWENDLEADELESLAAQEATKDVDVDVP